MEKQGVILITPTELYNLLNEFLVYPEISDPNYLLLLDARQQYEYNESHIIVSKKAPVDKTGRFVPPFDAELECKRNIVVYDSKANNLKIGGPALDCAHTMWACGSRNPVMVLEGGYEVFSALYPFLRTQQIIYMPRQLDAIQTFPYEIIPGHLYLGDACHANIPYIQKDLKVKGHINCTIDVDTFFKEEGPNLLNLPTEDIPDAYLTPLFTQAVAYMNNHRQANSVILVYSKLGISRSVTIIVAYLMHHMRWDLKKAYIHVQKCCVKIRPNRGFMKQLSDWEVAIFSEKLTDINQPGF